MRLFIWINSDLLIDWLIDWYSNRWSLYGGWSYTHTHTHTHTHRHFLRICKVSTMFTWRVSGANSQQRMLRFIYIYFLGIFLLFFMKKIVFLSFSLPFFDEVLNLCNRILTNQKLEYVIRNCQWNCMFYTPWKQEKTLLFWRSQGV